MLQLTSWSDYVRRYYVSVRIAHGFVMWRYVVLGQPVGRALDLFPRGVDSTRLNCVPWDPRESPRVSCGSLFMSRCPASLCLITYCFFPFKFPPGTNKSMHCTASETYRGADKSLARPDWKNNWKVAIFRPTRRSLLPRRPGWTDNLLNWFLSGLQNLEFGRCSLFPSWSG